MGNHDCSHAAAAEQEGQRLVRAAQFRLPRAGGEEPDAMIIVRLSGGLGNQMFQYAAARRLAAVGDV
jgi:hypothetical protein